jgi:hypothetical protein
MVAPLLILLAAAVAVLAVDHVTQRNGAAIEFDAESDPHGDACTLPNEGGGDAPVVEWDATRGYLIACLCMGRYGNQIDQLLGSIHFARRTGRVYVAPPLVNWVGGRTFFIPFEQVFNLSRLNEHHPTVSMEHFASGFGGGSGDAAAPTSPARAARAWAAGVDGPVVHCIDRGRADFEPADCRLKAGQASGDFWTRYYGAGAVATLQRSLGVTYQWEDDAIARAVDADRVRVLALAGASQIAPFPAIAEVRPLHRCVHACAPA